jgi:hypothetical protein
VEKVVMIFPDTYSMADFLIKEEITNAEANSVEQSIIAIITSKQIEIAEMEFGAIIRSMIKAE